MSDKEVVKGGGKECCQMVVSDKSQCISCDRWLETDFLDKEDPLDTITVYGGLVFTSSGHYGSTVFDPMVTGREEHIAVIICDDCLRSKAKRVTRMYNIERKRSSKAGVFNPDS